VECVSQYYDIPDSERSDEEITMLRQVTFLAYDLLTHSINLFSQNQSSYSHLLACRLQSIAQELYLMLPFSRILKFKNLLSAFYIHGKLWAWLDMSLAPFWCPIFLPMLARHMQLFLLSVWKLLHLQNSALSLQLYVFCQETWLSG